MIKSLAIFVLSVASGAAFAQTTLTPEGQSAQWEPGASATQLAQIHIDLMTITRELADSAAKGTQEPHTFCYFNDKAYSVGSKREGQVCVKVGNEAFKADGTLDREKSDPLRWISAEQAAHGNF